jgi:ribosome-associated toxin RatA of RatAB toxin-antitoxin module
MPVIKDKKTLMHPVDKVFGVALDLANYPKILPYIKSVHVFSQTEDTLQARIRLGFSMITFTYLCDIKHKKNEFITVTSYEPVFKHFASHCTFAMGADDTTIITYVLDCQFANPVIEILTGAIMPFHTKATMNAFEKYLKTKS